MLARGGRGYPVTDLHPNLTPYICFMLLKAKISARPCWSQLEALKIYLRMRNKHIMFACGEVHNCLLIRNQEKCPPTLQEGTWHEKGLSRTSLGQVVKSWLTLIWDSFLRFKFLSLINKVFFAEFEITGSSVRIEIKTGGQKYHWNVIRQKS